MDARRKSHLAGMLKRFGSPLYWYDGSEIDRRLRDLRNILPEGSDIFYSIKANPFPPIVRYLKSLGCRMEVCSLSELSLALEDDYPPSRILYTGPGKGEEEIRSALASGVSHFSCESTQEWKKLSGISERLAVDCNVIFRINPGSLPVHGLSMSGTSTQFGMDEDFFISWIKAGYEETPRCRALGIHVYYGTQVRVPSALQSTFSTISELAARLPPGAMRMKVVDFGGGFPWPYGEEGETPRLEAISGHAFSALEDMRRGGLKLWFEAGRYLVASCGTLLLTVVDVKASKGKLFVIADAGINHLGGMAGLGKLHPAKVSLHNLDGDNATQAVKADLVGPLCSPLDLLGRQLEIPFPEAGKAFAIPNVGAYGLTASLVAFLGRPAPVEVFEVDGRVEASRLRFVYGDA